MPANEPASHVRAFVAACLEERVLDKVQREQTKLTERIPRDAIRWTGREQLHLTLRFLGNVSNLEVEPLAQALKGAVAGIRSFRLGAGQLGCFPSPRQPRVIWVGLEGELNVLAELQSKIKRACEPFASHAESREFHPHLTIGRVKAFGRQAARVGEVLQATIIEGLGDWLISEIVLIQSELRPQGSVYSRLATLPLGLRSDSP